MANKYITAAQMKPGVMYGGGPVSKPNPSSEADAGRMPSRPSAIGLKNSPTLSKNPNTHRSSGSSASTVGARTHINGKITNLK